MLHRRVILLGCLAIATMTLGLMPAMAGEEVAIDAWVVDKVTSTVDGWTEYIYAMDYQRDYDYKGPINDFHVHLGNWTAGHIEIIPPENWVGQWQGGSYGCETNQNPYIYGNYYVGSWKIRVQPGYGDGSGYYVWTHDTLPVGHHANVPIPLTPEPASLTAIGIGLVGLAGLTLRRRRM